MALPPKPSKFVPNVSQNTSIFDRWIPESTKKIETDVKRTGTHYTVDSQRMLAGKPTDPISSVPMPKQDIFNKAFANKDQILTRSVDVNDKTNGGGRLGRLPKIDRIDTIEIAKYLNAKNIAKDNAGLYKDIAEITARNQLPLLQDSNRRFILPQYNAARTQIDDARLQSKLHNSMFADAKVATAG